LSNCVAATIEDRNKAELKFDVSPSMQIEGNYEKVIGMLQKRYGGNCARLVQDRYGGEKQELIPWGDRLKGHSVGSPVALSV
jgi:hypothetical protein